MQHKFDQIDYRITNWMARYGILLLRISVGIVFFWFGFLKFFPGLSPAQDLATRTIDVLTFGLVPPEISIVSPACTAASSASSFSDQHADSVWARTSSRIAR